MLDAIKREEEKGEKCVRVNEKERNGENETKRLRMNFRVTNYSTSAIYHTLCYRMKWLSRKQQKIH